MAFPFRSFRRHGFASTRNASRVRPRSRPLVLEALEDRSLPSGLAASVLEVPVIPNANSAAVAKVAQVSQGQGNGVAALFRASFSGGTLLIVSNGSFSVNVTQTSTTGNASTPTVTVTPTFTDPSLLSALVSARTTGQNTSNPSLQDSSQQFNSPGSNSTTTASSSTNQDTQNTANRSNPTTPVKQPVANFVADFRFFIVNRNQPSIADENQTGPRPVSPLPTIQPVSVPTPSTFALPSRGGFGQEDYQPLAIPDSPFTSFDIGVDEALRGQRSAPDVDGTGLSVLDQLFREWLPAVPSPKNDTHSVFEKNVSDESQAAPRADEPPAPADNDVKLLVVPPAEENLSTQWPLTETSATDGAGDNQGSALAGANGLLVAERPENSTPPAAASTDGNDLAVASLALLALAYPVGKEFRAKQQRRPRLAR